MNKRIGSDFDEFLKEEGIREEVEAVAMKRVIAWQVREVMDEMGLTVAEMARRMETSRSQINRLLDAEDIGVTLATLAKASKALGLHLQLVMDRGLDRRVKTTGRRHTAHA